jgi:HlyD family secretion protein
VDVGQTVAASLQAPVLFTIAQDLTKMQVDTSVDEADIGRVRLDGSATFTVDAFAGETFNGRVVQIRKAALVVQNVVTYTVVVAVDNPEGKLLPGMTANVKLIVAEKPSVLKVPNAALRFRPPGGESTEGSSSRAAAASGGGERGQPSLAEIRERLVTGLNLSAEQQAQLDPILEDSRQQMAEVRQAGLAENEHRRRAQRIRQATRARIRDILTPAQKEKYDVLRSGEQAGVPGNVFVLGANGKPKRLAVNLGLTDGTATEVVSGDIKEGQEIIVGTMGGSNAPARPGGGGGTGGGGGPRLRL